MPFHDDYARRTPFERALPGEDFAARHFEAMTREAERRGTALEDPGGLAMLESTGAALEELRLPSEGMETLPRHAALLFHAFHHHRAGHPLVLVRSGVVRYLVDTEPGAGEEDADGLAPGSYVQLPQHLLWVHTDEADPPLSLDGFFWTCPEPHTLHLLGVAGLLEGRPGFTVLQLPPVPMADAAVWATAAARPDEEGDDFASDLPGSELEHLLEVRTAGELLKLGARLDRYLRRFPATRQEARPAADPPDDPPLPSALPYTLVTLAGS